MHDNKAQIEYLGKLNNQESRLVLDDVLETLIGNKINLYTKPNKEKQINYIEYIKNKNVVLVGCAGYLQNQNKGCWIDNFDVVIKVNNSIGVLPENDYGARLDVLYHVLLKEINSSTGRKNIGLSDIKNWVKHNIKYLVSRYPQESKKVKDFGKINNNKINLECISKEFSKQVKLKIGSKTPNTGVLAIAHLLSMPIKSLTVVGFDFYNSGVADNYDGFKDGKEAIGINEKRHDSKAQIKYLKQLHEEQSDRLILDDVMLNLFKQN
jgi:hypothetical protein